MVFEQKKIAISRVVFCSHAAISVFFFQFFGLDFFFLNEYPNPFIVHSGPRLLFEPNFFFIAIGFLFTCGILTLIFDFF